jgi:hypothetical protein
MEKTIQIGNKEVRLNNNIGWTIDYRDQFGTDIIPTLLPMVAAALDLIKGLLEEMEDTSNLEWQDVLKTVDGDTLLDALVHLGGLEFKDFINVTWAMAKCADETIPEPRTWVRQFETFPLDEIAPAVFELIYKGIISSKNLTRLKNLKTLPLQPTNQ